MTATSGSAARVTSLWP